MRTALAVAFVMVLVLPHTAFAQTMEWNRTFGGTSVDVSRGMDRTSDGGHIITGRTESFGAGMRDVWLIKTDSNGIKQWDKTFGGTSDDIGQSVRQTNDGGYVITGSTESFGAGNEDIFLIKTDSNGTKQWIRIFGGPHRDGGFDVRQTIDGGYIITGITQPDEREIEDMWLIKTDSLGNELWSKTYGADGHDGGTSVQQTDDGGYIVTGYTCHREPSPSDLLLIKTDEEGNVEWNTSFGDYPEDIGYGVEQTGDGGYIITGATKSYGAGDYDVWLIKTDAGGTKQWDKLFGAMYDQRGLSVQETDDGGYIIAGDISYSEQWSYDAWLIKTDIMGNKLWEMIFTGIWDDRGVSVQQTVDGGYIIAGETSSYGAGSYDVWLIKVSKIVLGLSRIHLYSPADGAVLSSAPTFSWTPDGGTDNVFAVDLCLSPFFFTYYSTYENLHAPIFEKSWAMPDSVWDMIPAGVTAYWRVRGADLGDPPLAIITSDEAWSFTKQ